MICRINLGEFTHQQPRLVERFELSAEEHCGDEVEDERRMLFNDNILLIALLIDTDEQIAFGRQLDVRSVLFLIHRYQLDVVEALDRCLQELIIVDDRAGRSLVVVDTALRR